VTLGGTPSHDAPTKAQGARACRGRRSSPPTAALAILLLEHHGRAPPFAAQRRIS